MSCNYMILIFTMMYTYLIAMHFVNTIEVYTLTEYKDLKKIPVDKKPPQTKADNYPSLRGFIVFNVVVIGAGYDLACLFLELLSANSGAKSKFSFAV